MTIIHVLCEGQTEAEFVNSVLKPYLMDHGIQAVKPVILVTNWKLNAEGGIAGYQYVVNHLKILYRSNPDTSDVKHVFTTMFDFYQLRNDFPEYGRCSGIQDKYFRVEALEQAFAQHQNESRFVPYIQLHEFETLIFCGIGYLKDMYPKCIREIDGLSQVLDRQPNPELINDGLDTAPSKRIIAAIENGRKYRYNKPKSGKYVTVKTGIEELMNRCGHFRNWVNKLVSLGNADIH